MNKAPNHTNVCKEYVISPNLMCETYIKCHHISKPKDIRKTLGNMKSISDNITLVTKHY